MNKNTNEQNDKHNKTKKQWLERWQNEQIGFHQNDINVYLKKYFNKFSNDSNCVFTPFCGKSLDMKYISDMGKNVIGVELVKSALDSFVSENDLKKHSKTKNIDNFLYYDIKMNKINKGNIELLCGDFFSLQKKHLQINTKLNSKMDIFDRASLVALNVNDRLKYSLKILELFSNNEKIKKGGKMLLVTLNYDEKQKQGPPYSVSNEEVYKLYGDSCNIELLEKINLKDTNNRYDDLSYMFESVYLLSLK
jgi:thiopurine S-methyltransferase